MFSACENIGRAVDPKEETKGTTIGGYERWGYKNSYQPGRVRQPKPFKKNLKWFIGTAIPPDSTSQKEGVEDMP